MKRLTAYPLRGVIFAALLLCLVLRFSHLDTKPFWYDETMGALRISGYLEEEVAETTTFEQPTTVAELSRFQTTKADSTMADTVRALVVNNPQHPPLYYGLNQVWSASFGDSVAARRGFSAMLSLLSLPFLYGLCRALFPTPAVGLWAILLTAASPLQMLYAQEARQYSLFFLLSVAASMFLVRAQQSCRRSDWTLYSVFLTLGLYTHLFFGFVLVAHLLYIIVLRRGWRAYSLALTASLIGFSPWLWTLAQGWGVVQTTTSHTAGDSLPLSYMAKSWLLNLSRCFIDFNASLGERNQLIALVPLYGMVVICAFGIAYRRLPRRVFVFLTLLASVNIAALVIPDLLLGGQRSLVARYFMPSYLAVTMVMAYWLATWIQARRIWQRRMGIGLAVWLICGAVGSNVAIAAAPSWWNKSSGYYDPQVAQIVNQSQQPVVISDAISGMILALCHQLKGDVQLWVQPKCRTCRQAVEARTNLPLEKLPQAGTLFLYRPSDALVAHVSQRYDLELRFMPERSPYQPKLWQLVPKPSLG